MRKSGMGAALVLCTFLAAPSLALGVGDLAKVVLNNGSVLSTGQKKCGTALGLTPGEQLQMAFARSAAKKALPLADFLSLDQASDAAATTASQSPTFCTETVKKKSGLLAKIGRAAKGLAGARLGL